MKKLPSTALSLWPGTLAPTAVPSLPLPELSDHITLFHIVAPAADYVARHKWLDKRLKAAHTREEKKASQLVLRQLLAFYLNIKADELILQYGERGKPYVDDATLYFNVSDTANGLFIAVNTLNEIGVDVEQLNRTFNHAAVIGRQFNHEDQQQYQTLEAEQRRLWALYAWTRLEAQGKALGEGIRFTRCAFPLMNGFPADGICGEDNKRIWLTSKGLDYIDAIVSIASTATTQDIELFTIGPGVWQHLMQ